MQEINLLVKITNQRTFDCRKLKICLKLIWGKGKDLKKHSKQKENSSLGFIEAVHQ